jgi:hypothetical protein
MITWRCAAQLRPLKGILCGGAWREMHEADVPQLRFSPAPSEAER